jgi:hypothetical protein
MSNFLALRPENPWNDQIFLRVVPTGFDETNFRTTADTQSRVARPLFMARASFSLAGEELGSQWRSWTVT